jgi:hypothetical protein
MRYASSGRCWPLAAVPCLTALMLPADDRATVRAADPPGVAKAANAAANDEPKYDTLHITGRVVWLADALRALYGIETDPDVAHAQVALKTTDGRLYPIAKDARGRAFSLDERIRDIDVELIVRRYRDAPVVQMVKMYTLKDAGKYEFDYWCDICAIPMYELKPCECCQGDIRIRERRVADAPTSGDR